MRVNIIVTYHYTFIRMIKIKRKIVTTSNLERVRRNWNTDFAGRMLNGKNIFGNC